MKRKSIVLILLIVMILNMFTGCSSAKKGDLETENADGGNESSFEYGVFLGAEFCYEGFSQ